MKQLTVYLFSLLFYCFVFLDCKEGYFGTNCLYTCKNCKYGGICNKAKNSCICKAGYTGLLCSYPCPQVRMLMFNVFEF